MATDSHGMGIPLPPDSTKVHQFPGVTRLAMERVAEILATGQTESMDAAAVTAVAGALAGADIVKGTDARLPATVNNAEYAAVTVDNNGRVSEGTRANGRKHLPQADIDEAAVGKAVVTDLTATKFTSAGQTVSQVDSPEYSKVTVDTEGRIAEDALDGAGRVPAWVLGAWASRMAPELRAAMGVAPALKLSAFGDSMTAGAGGNGTTWPMVAAADLGWSYYNGGISSQTSTEIALRQGGLEVLVTVEGNSIPATGAVNVTALTPAGTYANLAWTFPGTLAGVPGTLSKSVAHVWTFTRTTAGAAVACIPNTRFMSAAATPNNGWLNVFWAGRNNVNTAIVTRDIAAMVAGLTPLKPRYLVLSVLNSSTEPSGSAGYNSVIALNNALAAAYGANYYDLRRYLIDYGLAAAGITPTAADTTAIAEDRIPASLMSDTLHLTAAGYTAVGHRIAAIITEKSWTL
jgi:lysophospholipase L1-like esterase